jgi:1,4-alpha-glucan branching enzyme
VAIAGDFTDWAPNLGMDDSDGDGIWTVRVPMKPGVHEYMFLIDGTRWVTDPNAERYEQDGYGHSNAILAVPHVRTAGL